MAANKKRAAGYYKKSASSSKNRHKRYRLSNRRKAPGTRKLVLFNKPMNVLCQFRTENGQQTLADYLSIPDVYPAGRLDKDSEGLLLLTNDGALQHRISHPSRKLSKTYWVQVEGIPDEVAIKRLQAGVELKNGLTQPATVRLLSAEQVEQKLWPRQPPIRFRANIPTSWLEIILTEGKNRQVRRMTAAVGLPTLRLVRVAIGPWRIWDLKPGEYALLTDKRINLD